MPRATALWFTKALMVFADVSIDYVFKQEEVGTKSLEILVKPRTTVEIKSYINLNKGF